jgi:Tol biopolymer transport system component
VAVDHRGNERPVGIPPNLFSWPRVSPDGKRIAVEIGTGTGRFDVWLFEIASRTLSRLTNNFSGVRPSGWTTDGSRVVYLAVDGNSADQPHRRVALIPWDLSGPPAHLTTDSAANPEDASLGPPGSVLAVRYSGYTLPGDIAVAPVESPRAMRSFVATPADEETPRVSPDGKWLAYASDETGSYEIYARPVNGSGGRLLISAGGGAEPVWARDGRSLYYRGPEKMMLAALTTTPTLTVTKRDTLFTDVYRKETKAVQYDVFPNGELLMEKVETRAGGRPTVVINWFELLRRHSGTVQR